MVPYFSTGEIVLYNIIRKISKINENSLVLIDEIDLSLNSKTQIKLLKYLEEMAKQKNIIMILSTHSPVIIKSVHTSKIYHLEKTRNGKIDCINPCYPSYALNDFSSKFDMNLEYIFLVEDVEARFLLNEMISKYFELSERKDRPKYRILSIGGYAQVLDFLHSNRDFIEEVKMYGFFDLDVEEEISKHKLSTFNGSMDFIQKYEVNKNRIAMLPITPELGIVEGIIEVREEFREFLKSIENCSIERNLSIVENNDYLKYTNDRQGAKKKLDLVTESVARDTGLEQFLVRKSFYKYYVNKILDNGKLQSLIGKALS